MPKSPRIELDKARALVSGAVPLAVESREYRQDSGSKRASVSIGAKILAVADLYDEISERLGNVQPWWESVEQIKRKGRFDSLVIAAIKKVLTNDNLVTGQ